MKTYVLDASIVLNYLFSESNQVKTLIEKIIKQAADKKISLLSTPLLSIEVANGLRFKLSDSTLAKQVISSFLSLPITLRKLTNTELLQSTESSYLYNTTIYDSTYHILAISHNATFLTCDQKYYNHAKKLGHIELYS